MNKWKVAFWISIVVLFSVTGLFIYEQTDQAFKTVRTSINNSKTYQDLDAISKILNETNLTKPEIQNSLKEHKLFNNWDFERDTISLERLNLIFKNNKLNKIIEQQ